MFIDPYDYDALKDTINGNIKRIEKIAKEGNGCDPSSEKWFEAWNLIKVTANLIEQLSEESRKLDNKMDN